MFWKRLFATKSLEMLHKEMEGENRLLAVDSGAAVYDFDTQRAIGTYEATSDIATPSPAELRTAGRNYPPQIAAAYLQLPQIDPRVPQLAQQVTGNANNDFDKAATIENHLRTHFGYTLELPRAKVKDPIANFLFQRKRGAILNRREQVVTELQAHDVPSLLDGRLRPRVR